MKIHHKFSRLGSPRFRAMLRRCFSSFVVLLFTTSALGGTPYQMSEYAFDYPSVFQWLKQSLEVLGREDPKLVSAAIQGQNQTDSKTKDCRERVEIARHALFSLEYCERSMSAHDLGAKHYGGGIIEKEINSQSVGVLNAKAREFFRKHEIPFAKSDEFPVPRIP